MLTVSQSKVNGNLRLLGVYSSRRKGGGARGAASHHMESGVKSGSSFLHSYLIFPRSERLGNVCSSVSDKVRLSYLDSGKTMSASEARDILQIVTNLNKEQNEPVSRHFIKDSTRSYRLYPR